MPVDADAAVVGAGRSPGVVEVVELGPGPGFVRPVRCRDEEGIWGEEQRLGFLIAGLVFGAAAGTGIARHGRVVVVG